MTFLYGRDWHPTLRKPIGQLDGTQARSRWKSGPPFSVSSVPQPAAGQVPAYTLVLGPEGEFVKTYRYNPAGSIVSIYTFRPWEERAGEHFLKEVTVYLYPDDDRWYDQTKANAISTFSFRPDGWARRRLDIKAAPHVQVEEYTDVDVSDHWVPSPTFGDWDRFGIPREPATI